jgi:hypothetical protein
VLVNTKENQQPLIVSQPCMVLRSQFNDKKLTVHNTDVLMVYEQWDLPIPKDYQRYQKQGSANRFFRESPLTSIETAAPLTRKKSYYSQRNIHKLS